MIEYIGLCCGCLVRDRRVWRLKDVGIEHLYEELCGNQDLNGWDELCWECISHLRKIWLFRDLVQSSRSTLLTHSLQDPTLSHIDEIVRSSTLQIQKVFLCQYPELVTEIEDVANSTVKNEGLMNEEVHFEFIKSEDHSDHDGDALDHEGLFDLNPQPELDTLLRSEVDDTHPRKEIKPKRAKKEKSSKEKRTARKKKVSEATKKPTTEPLVENGIEVNPDAVSSDGLTDLESLADLYEDQPVATEKKRVISEVQKVTKRKIKELYDPSEIEVMTLTHDEMLKEREKDRLEEYYANCPHQCADCILGFKYERTLHTHMETKHNESAGVYECDICRVRLPTSSELSEHINRHLRRYKCVMCGKRSVTLLPMVKHVKIHKEYKCDICGHTSGSLFRHQTHVSREHKEKPKCNECNKTFSSAKTYRYHINVIHKGQNRFPCPHCGKIYQWKSNLWRHIKSHKARDSGELVCVPCDKKFSSIATYQQHLKISRKHVTEDEFNYICSECGKKFVNKTRLKDHVDWEHLKKINYRCELCNKPFKSHTSLYVHLQNVHKNKGEKDNLCHVCGKSYQNPAKLKYHIIAMHTTQMPYACDQCPSAFSWYSSLYRHVKEVHEKVKVKKKRPPRRKDSAPNLAEIPGALLPAVHHPITHH